MSKTYERNFTNLRFLVVDDKAFIRKTVQSMLFRLRAKQVVLAGSGSEALEELRKNGGKFDCILSDWNMQPVSGLELLRMIRAGNADHTSPEIPFIMLTGHAESGIVHTAKALDIHGYIIKPVSLNMLVKAVDSAMQRHISLKASNHYRTVPGVRGTPDQPQISDAKAPWVMWMTRAPQRKQFEHCLQDIRSIAAALNRGQIARSTKLQNRRESTVMCIPVGTVLAEAVYDADCKLLIDTGTQMTPTLISRLQHLATESGQDPTLWIGDY